MTTTTEHNAFCERHMFWKKSGELVGPAELRAWVLRRVRTSPLPKVADLSSAERIARVDAILADDGFLRSRHGYLMSRIAEDVEDRIFSDLYAAK